MLVLNDSSALGDKKLSAEEGLSKLQEENRALSATRKIHAQDELELAERAWGPQLSYREVIRKLQRLNPNILAIDGSAGQVGIYVRKNRQELDESWDEVKDDKDHYDWWKYFKYVTGCPKDFIPEYGFVIADERGIAKREKRGWRSILIALIKNKALTYKEAVDSFGEALGPRSHLWHEQLRTYKQ